MKKLFAILLSALFLIGCALSLTGCGQKSLGAMDQTVADMFNEMYEHLNQKDYEIVRTYYEYSDDDLTTMIDNFKNYAEIVKTTYKLESATVSEETEDGLYVAEVVTLNTFVLEEAAQTNVIRETSSYLLRPDGDSFKIVSYTNLSNEIVSSDLVS